VSDLTRLTAREIASAVRERRQTAREITEACIARIAAMNTALNAIIGFDADAARAEADAVDARIAAGKDLPLAGGRSGASGRRSGTMG
jgi:Asp-tRNA(Asn)/Glu-tRNA(Gln) amidotransferase A subunit family amidase